MTIYKNEGGLNLFIQGTEAERRALRYFLFLALHAPRPLRNNYYYKGFEEEYIVTKGDRYNGNEDRVPYYNISRQTSGLVFTLEDNDTYFTLDHPRHIRYDVELELSNLDREFMLSFIETGKESKARHYVRLGCNTVMDNLRC